jgi:polyhydroxybutyrate depolymerase
MTDSVAKQFWNADATCCDFDHKNPDDVGYLGTLIEQVRTVWPIDPNQVAVIGYAGGGTMAYRLACERADLVSNVVVLAGPVASTPCAPARSVNVLHVHGTADATVPYSVAGPSVQQWAVNDHCGSSRVLGASVDIDGSLAGNETVTESVVGCPAGVRVDLWTIEGGSHTPSVVPTFDPIARQWIIEHPRS